MPEKENLFSQAENDRYNVCNVLSDDAFSKRNPIDTPVTEEEPVINLEEGAPFLEGIDPDATIGEYMQRYEEEEQEYQDDEEPQQELMEQPEEISQEIEEPQTENVKSSVIRDQAEKARASFIDDLQSLDNELGLEQQSKDIDEEEPSVETETEPTQNEVQEMPQEEEDDDDMPDPITLKDLIKPATRRIKKPQFIKQEEIPSYQDEDNAALPESSEEPSEADQKESASSQETAQNEASKIKEQNTAEEDLSSDLAEARAAQKKGQSICEDLHHLQSLLEEGRSPLLHKTEVLVPREKTLRLIRSLTAICEVDPSYIDCASEDKLIDRLVSDQSEDDYKPLERARNRAQTIIQNATKQADTILGDAKTLARQLLAETEAEIKEKFDAADEQIAVRMTTTKEESTKKLNEARSELTASRQRSVEILSKYLEKAENDYQGYWERAENTVMASLEQSDAILSKAADIYRKELIAIHQDKEELDEILNSMKKYKKRRFGQ